MPPAHVLKYDHDVAEAYAKYRGVRPEVLARLLEDSVVDRDSRVLEVGCGIGDYIIAMQFVTGCTAFGIDISEEMLVHAERRDTPVSFAVGTAEYLDFPDASLDFVFTVDVVQHLGGPAGHYREAYRVLAPGRRLCTMTHSDDMFRNSIVLSRYFPETVEVNLERYPTVEALCGQMTAAGFGDLHDDEIAYPAEVANSALYASKAYSTLHMIPEEAFERGLAALERDLERGPITGERRYLMLWATK